MNEHIALLHISDICLAIIHTNYNDAVLKKKEKKKRLTWV